MSGSNNVSLFVMKILITGTHFTPALAVINELKRQENVEIIYVGRRATQEGDSTSSVESEEIPKHGVKFMPIITGRLQRSFTLYTVPSLLKIPIGFIQAFFIILKTKPDVILSFGGYVGVPIVFWGWLFSKPVIIHEQTLTSGAANRISSAFADKIAVSFTYGYSFNPKKIILTGNPIRDEVLNPDKKLLSADYQRVFNLWRKQKLPIVLFMGGNQGSHILNMTVEESLNKLKKIAAIIHVTGDNKFSDYERLGKLQSDKYLVKKWIGREFGAVLSKVDLVVCRGGINTLVELAYLGKKALVIPLTFLYQDEQDKNAKYFEKLGMVKILPQAKLSADSLLENIKVCLNGLKVWDKEVREARKAIIPDGAKRLALETILLGKNV